MAINIIAQCTVCFINGIIAVCTLCVRCEEFYSWVTFLALSFACLFHFLPLVMTLLWRGALSCTECGLRGEIPVMLQYPSEAVCTNRSSYLLKTVSQCSQQSDGSCFCTASMFKVRSELLINSILHRDTSSPTPFHTIPYVCLWLPKQLFHQQDALFLTFAVWRVSTGNENLTPIGPRTRVCHGKETCFCMLQDKVLILKLLSVNRLAASLVAIGKVTSLYHKVIFSVGCLFLLFGFCLFFLSVASA